MSEPPEVAGEATAVADGVWWWQIHNSRIGGATSSCHLLDHPGGAVLVDPLHLADDVFATLPAVTAICLTAKCHQRSAWRYRRATEAPVWAPEGAAATDEEPDHRYRHGDRLPGGLIAVRTPGPEPVHYCFLAERTPPALICSDLLSGDGRSLRFVPFEYHDDPAATRASVESLLDLDFSLLLLDHGPPVADGKAAIRSLLASG